ncbi:hypothetical protein Srot_2655 [Segniliparus rotundus DSM 44985]|uniref:Uncharacterized protein n=1 Tax=Segniliparus rotundus (strain ATCC BAA-972 / CDC 1076 / CIP 108378 / DSM 44985 / JCM 13578) TaxID=640132 RepID=D6ZCC0_SEGRD|nr:hypothetical protein [Segniliparus rotundus]ADG99089.1 hypothetical protein Srot_2655 [Segniliparus rotundus DSM 44985]
MTRFALAAALAPALFPLVAPGAAHADPEPNPDCVVLRQAAGGYSKMADHFSTLRKVSERPASTPDQHADTLRQLAQQSRTMGEMLRDLSAQLTSQDLKTLYWDDAESFDDYADALIRSINSGNSSELDSVYRRNVRAVNAANDAFHAACGRQRPAAHRTTAVR